MQKIIFTVLVSFFMLLSCSSDDDGSEGNNNISNCDDTILISKILFDTAPSDQLFINNLEIIGNCLTINFSSGGCDGNSWEVKLIDSEAILESNPPQRNLRLSLKNEELCLAFITKELSFDISSLRMIGSPVQLNITNSDDTILY
ncbi:hypothetical protein [Aquimarina algicola]|uniref:Uncharacterized protein n=1 Tax=Aquimarina algicola TaxID=2589995 RepID=A0A504JM88_9FLAO|nr:hypothetical protein [Aquimarina algicola]TPN88868.1 hypothetical protein FHK87_01240 [Aquimarina algicola]